MNHFEAFCKATPKNKHGYVPDLLDMESDLIRDQATVAMLRDLNRYHDAEDYRLYSDDMKGEFYRSLELVMQDEVDKFNDKIDKDRIESMQDDAYFDAHWKYTGTNSAMFDAGFKSSDFC